MKTHQAVRWHGLQIAEAVELLDTDLEKGLLDGQARIRLAKYGPNRVTRRPGVPAWKSFLLQFHQPLIYILLLAGAVTAALGEVVDSSVIVGVVLVNAVVGCLQESKAERAIDSLSQLTRNDATVRRDGKRRRVASDELVPGDVVILDTGDRVPADLRLTAAHDLRVDESALTGESLPVRKHPGPVSSDAMLADRSNLAFAGTLVTSGNGQGVVWATGDRTETGGIAWLISAAVNLTTPLTRKVAASSQLLLWLILGLSGIVVLVGLRHGKEPVEIFMPAVALAVGAIPEGLPAVVTITLAIGVARMAARRAIIRNLPAVETLGSTTTICSDKTGTLTKNQMTVQEIYAGGRLFEVTGTGYDPAGDLRLDSRTTTPRDHPALVECLKAGLLCNDSQLVQKEGRWEIQGDPTEAALIVAARKAGLLPKEIDLAHPRIDAIPFESENQFMATLHKGGGGKERMIYKKGAAGITLAFETKESDIMDRPPRPPRAPLLSFELLMRTGLVSLLMLGAAFGIFFWESHHGATIAEARTATVNVIIFVGIFYLLHPVLSLGLFSNRWLLADVAAMVVAQLAFTYAPFMNAAFHSHPLDADSWLRLIAIAFGVSMIVAFEKRLRSQAGTHRDFGSNLEPAADRI
jgi:cation-transporting P-type ATPase F